jgi:hypothetical protein
MMKTFLGILILCVSIISVSAQDIGTGEVDILSVRKKEWDIYGTLHTNGLGIGTRIGKQHSIRKKSGIDIEWTYYRLLKEQRGKTSFTLEGIDNKSFVYGKLNNFTQIRLGYGFTYLMNTKPYWGGLSTGYFLYGGPSVGISVPVYLYIMHYIQEEQTIVMNIEKYDPDKHDLSNIYGRAPFKEGLKHLKIHPGLYVKTGLTFDFSTDDAQITALDIGIALDAYLFPIQKMAYHEKQHFLITGFLTFHFGQRLTNYE